MEEALLIIFTANVALLMFGFICGVLSIMLAFKKKNKSAALVLAIIGRIMVSIPFCFILSFCL